MALEEDTKQSAIKSLLSNMYDNTAVWQCVNVSLIALGRCQRGSSDHHGQETAECCSRLLRSFGHRNPYHLRARSNELRCAEAEENPNFASHPTFGHVRSSSRLVQGLDRWGHRSRQGGL